MHILLLHLINIKNFSLDNILIDEDLYENIFIYSTTYIMWYGAQPLRIIFDKINGYIRNYYGTKYLVIFRSGKKADRIFKK